MLTKTLASSYDYLAPDGSEIRLLAETAAGGLSHCTLPPGAVSTAVRHRTVQEIWYVLEGNGEIWRRDYKNDCVTLAGRGTSILIERGVHFQFRAIGIEPLQILISTMPRWPGAEEAEPVPNYW